MIVDLIRNDLGRLARVGSVSVENMYAVETYSTLHQMVSTVHAEVAGEPSVLDIFRHLFPCGSVKFRDGDVQVGQHIPPSTDALEKFMERFEDAYAPEKLSRLRRVIAVPASHHRLLWIHPFYDGNGRVVRMHSHAYLKEIGIGSRLWSVSRGLARRVSDYKRLLMAADNPRQGDLDGRGNLSVKALTNFCVFFLETCIDQVEFMESMLKPTELIRRIERYTDDAIQTKKLPKGSFQLLREALHAGEFKRGRAPEITGYKERQAGIVLNTLVEKGLLVADTPKGAVRLGFPNEVVDWWFPRLYPVA